MCASLSLVSPWTVRVCSSMRTACRSCTSSTFRRNRSSEESGITKKGNGQDLHDTTVQAGLKQRKAKLEAFLIFPILLILSKNFSYGASLQVQLIGLYLSFQFFPTS